MTEHDSNERLVELAAAASPAAPGPDAGEHEHGKDLVFLRVGGRWFAVEATAVREVTSRGGITRVPTAPRHVLGVMLVRGRLVPVVNLEELIGQTPSDETTQSLPRVVVLQHEDLEMGIAVDQIRGVVQLERPPSAASTASRSAERPSYLRDELSWEGRLACVLDPGAFIAAMMQRRST